MTNSLFETLTVLVVDDNRHMRAIYRTILTAFGVRRIIEAGDGADAFKEMQQVSPDAVLTGWNMQPLDGLEFVRLIRTAQDSPNPFVPIVMVTGQTEKRHVLAARDAGVHDFLAKPVSAEALCSRLVAAVTAPRVFVRTRSYFGPDRRRHRAYTYRGANRRKGSECMLLYPYGGPLPSEWRYAPFEDLEQAAGCAARGTTINTPLPRPLLGTLAPGFSQLALRAN